MGDLIARSRGSGFEARGLILPHISRLVALANGFDDLTPTEGFACGHRIG